MEAENDGPMLIDKNIKELGEVTDDHLKPPVKVKARNQTCCRKWTKDVLMRFTSQI